MEKLPVPVAVVTGVAPVAGAVTVMAAVEMVTAVCGNDRVNVTAEPVLFEIVAVCPFIDALNVPANL